MYPDPNVPLWEIPIQALYSGYLWVIIPGSDKVLKDHRWFGFFFGLHVWRLWSLLKGIAQFHTTRLHENQWTFRSNCCRQVLVIIEPPWRSTSRTTLHGHMFCSTVKMHVLRPSRWQDDSSRTPKIVSLIFQPSMSMLEIGRVTTSTPMWHHGNRITALKGKPEAEPGFKNGYEAHLYVPKQGQLFNPISLDSREGTSNWRRLLGAWYPYFYFTNPYHPTPGKWRKKTGMHHRGRLDKLFQNLFDIETKQVSTGFKRSRISSVPKTWKPPRWPTPDPIPPT